MQTRGSSAFAEDDERVGGNAPPFPHSPDYALLPVMTAAVQLSKVSKTFGAGADAVHAFGPVDLTIESGEFISLLGPSGCGKSTLMLMIAGLLEATDGEIHVNGQVVDEPRTD